MRLVKWALGAAVLGAAVYWGVTRPAGLDPAFAGVTGDAEAGALSFAAGGCASCHSAPGATGEAKLVLAGGKAFASPFGTFYAPNISPSEAGIGGWSSQDLALAMTEGVSPGGQHYFPAFPYTSYQKASPQDVAGIYAYVMTLPADATPSKAHEVGFPYNIRRNMGGWKFLFGGGDWAVGGELTEAQERGRYLVEGLAHCGECHTPRNALGGLQRGQWLGGAANPSGEGRIPNITPGGLDWSEGDIAEYLSSGFTPEFDTAGGEMVDVIENIAQLSDADRTAIAAYLKVVPSVSN
ncbi:cytochrome c [Alphaproteobacteria bacterium KMM 3653]|uniref:Cytochrome c n=1 Tax=Harenicola maris TaxID=2841044 RepID=A0AAP2G7X8_9RHOB|nr:cytochrome c [Harenicola maris]